MKRWPFVLLGAAALVVTACANPAATGSQEPTEPTISYSPLRHTFDWTRPPFHGQGVQVSSLEEAQARVSFVIYTPKELDGPTYYVSPEGTPVDLGAMYFVYADSPCGVVWIAESLPDIANEQERLDGYERTIQDNGKPGVWSTAEIATVRDVDTALLGAASDGVFTLEYVESGVQVHIMGPTLTRDEVLSIANSI